MGLRVRQRGGGVRQSWGGGVDSVVEGKGE